MKVRLNKLCYRFYIWSLQAKLKGNVPLEALFAREYFFTAQESHR